MVEAFGKRQQASPQEDAKGSQGVATGGPSHPPFTLQAVLRLGAQIAAAGLVGFGIILWVAAHWDGITRHQRLGLVGGALVLALAVSLVNAARTPGLILSFLAAGGLFALIGQTYQTGADPWQLFAVWAAVGLPLALAARADALWALWCVVVVLAITLWLATYAPFGWMAVDPAVSIAGWAIALVIAALLSPLSPISRWLGRTRWSFRLMLMLTVALITQSGLAAVLAGREVSALYWLAVLAVGGAAAALLALPAFDLVLASVAGLALDTLLISGFGRAVFSGARDFTVPFLLVGLAGAGLVAGTGAFILRLARDRGGRGDLHTLKGSEWPVILMTGIGALLTAVPLMVFLGLLLGPFLVKGPGPYLIGAASLAGAVAVVSRQPQASFYHQLGAIGLTLGFSLVAFALFRDMPSAITVVSGLLAALATGVALLLRRSWTAALMGGAAGVFAALFFNGLLSPPGPRWAYSFVTFRGLGWTLVLAAGAACYMWLSRAEESGKPLPGPLSESLSRFLAGAMAAALLGTLAASGPTFLLSGALGRAGELGELSQSLTGRGLTWSLLNLLSAALALAGCAWLLAAKPQMQTTLGLGASLIVVALSAIIPLLGGPVLLLCAALVTGHRPVAIGAFVTALWVIGSFYYWLGWPLTDKAALMLAAGIMLAVLCWLAGVRAPISGLGAAAAPSALARGLIVAGGVATGALAMQSVAANEEILASGRQIYLALAPVDPRSLMQGDFMRLNFAVPAEAQRSRPSLLGRRWAIAALDDRGVATVRQVIDEQPTAVAPGLIVLPMRVKNGRWIVGTDAWFFKEGTAKTWQRARFGVFRVGKDGTALLVGMADEALSILE